MTKFYRVSTVLAFTSEDEGRDFYHDGELALAKAVNINPGQMHEEKSFIQLEECHHGEAAVAPCVVLKRQEKPD